MAGRSCAWAATPRWPSSHYGHRALQEHGEGGALADLAAHGDAPAEGLDDAVGDPQAQARALTAALGGEEGLEDVRQHLLGDAAAVVGDLDADAAVGDQRAEAGVAAVDVRQ